MSSSRLILFPLCLTSLYSFFLVFIRVITCLYEEKGALLPTESQEVVYLIALRDFFQYLEWPILGAAFFSTFYTLSRLRQKIAHLCILFVFFGLVLSRFYFLWILLATYPLYLFFLWHLRNQTPSFSLARSYLTGLKTQGQGYFAFLVALLFAGLIAGISISLLEGFFHVYPHVEKGFTFEDFWGSLFFACNASVLHSSFLAFQLFLLFTFFFFIEPFQRKRPLPWNFWTPYLLLTLGILYSAQLYYFRYISSWMLKAFLIFGLMLGVWLFLKMITQEQKKSPALFFVLLASWMVLFLCIWFRVLVLGTFEHEIETFQFLPELFLLTLGNFPLIALCTSLNFLVFLQKKSPEPFLPRVFLHFWYSLFLFPAAFLKPRFLQQRSDFFLMGSASMMLFFILFALFRLNYTEVIDYSDVAQIIYSQMIIAFILVACFFGFSLYTRLFSKPFPFQAPKLLMYWGLLLGIAVSWIGYQFRNNIYAMIIAEYSVIWQIQSEPFRLDYFPDSMISLKRLQPAPFSFHQMPTFPPSPEKQKFLEEKPPIFIVLWDAGRPDHFSCYGYERRTTPNVDQFAKEAILFKNAYSQSTATSTGIRHLLTGKYSTRYMLDLENIAPFWLDRFVELEYHDFLVNTLGSFYNGTPKEAYTLKMPKKFQKLLRFYEVKGEEPERIEDIFKKIDQRKLKNRFYGYLHHVRTHTPWFNHPDATFYGKEPIDRYDNSINYLDQLFGRFIQELKKRNLYEKSIILLLADHGTGLNDHGRYGSFLPYQEQIRVPLLIKIPGFAPRQIEEPVGLIDVGPTLLNLFMDEVKNPYDGVSLLPLMRGETEQLPRDKLFVVCAFEDAYAVIENNHWKCVVHRRRQYWKLYDLLKDPQEKVNLAETHPDQIARFQQIFRAYFQNGLHSYSNPYHYRAWSYEEDH